MHLVVRFDKDFGFPRNFIHYLKSFRDRICSNRSFQARMISLLTDNMGNFFRLRDRFWGEDRESFCNSVIEPVF